MQVTVRNPRVLRWFGFHALPGAVPLVTQSLYMWSWSLYWALRYPLRKVKSRTSD